MALARMDKLVKKLMSNPGVYKNDVELYIYWVLGEIIGVYHKKFQDLNINKSYFLQIWWN